MIGPRCPDNHAKGGSLRGRPDWLELANTAIYAGMSEAPTTPICPRCGAPMRLAGKVPASFGYPELHSFACTVCREAVTVEVGKPQTSETQSRLRA
jgi:transposase-like protein